LAGRVLRVHFTARDLLHTRFAAAPAPLLELSLVLATLRRGEVLFAGTRRPARPRVPASALPMFTLLSATGNGPTFLDPVCADFAEGVDRVLAAPAEFVSGELARVLGPARRMRPWHRDLAGRDRRAWQTLTDAITAAHRSLLAPQWPAVVARHEADLASRALVMSGLGMQATLNGLFGGSRWAGSTLQIPSRQDRDEQLRGTGLTLMPSAHWTGGPLFTTHPDGSRVLIYPALRPPHPISGRLAGDPLGVLMGCTRAAALRVLAEQHSTSELAAAIGMSLATASEHASTLRSTGLITSARAGKAVIHRCSPLGLRLIAQVPQP
jgi:DNA-binding transcriptional ArsR family regulator